MNKYLHRLNDKGLLSTIGFTLLVLIQPSIHAKSLFSPGSVSIDALPVCYNFGCKTLHTVTLTEEEWLEVKSFFHPLAQNAEQEREQIQKAVGWLEYLVGQHTPTHKDIGYDLQGRDDLDTLFPGQMDCIDEAINVTSYLRLLEQHGLMQHHITIDHAYRQAVFDQHWAGHIREVNSDTEYVVDSWYRGYGKLPVMQESKSWHDISLLTAVVDNSPEAIEQRKKEPPLWRRVLGID